VFFFSCQLAKVRIWHDNKYMRAGWFLQSVDIIDEETEEKYNFPCDRWLAKDEDDGSLLRELSCSNNLAAAVSKENLAVAGNMCVRCWNRSFAFVHFKKLQFLF